MHWDAKLLCNNPTFSANKPHVMISYDDHTNKGVPNDVSNGEDRKYRLYGYLS